MWKKATLMNGEKIHARRPNFYPQASRHSVKIIAVDCYGGNMPYANSSTIHPHYDNMELSEKSLKLLIN